MATVTEDQHGMTPTDPDTETREVSQPSHTPGKNSVLSEPMRTHEREQLDGPLRSKSNSTKRQSTQLKQLSSPLRTKNAHSNPDRRYYQPSDDTKTDFVNSQGHLQSRKTPPQIIKPNAKANYQTAKNILSIIDQVQLSLMVQKSFELCTPILLTGLEVEGRI